MATARTFLGCTLATAVLLMTGGCKSASFLAQQVGGAFLKRNTHSGMTSSTRRAIDAGIDKAIAALEAAWLDRLNNPVDEDARVEERGRLRLAAEGARAVSVCSLGGPAQAAATKDPNELEASGAVAVGDTARAVKTLRALHERLAAEAGEADPATTRVAGLLALALLDANDTQGAVRFAVGSLEGRRQHAAQVEAGERPDADLQVAAAEAVLAQVYRAGAAYAEARAGYRNALDLRQRVLGAEDLCVARSRNDLGEVEYLSGHFAEAKLLYQEASRVERAKLPESDPERVRSDLDLGTLDRAIGLYDSARVFLTRALETRRRAGPESLEVAEAQHHLAALERARGDLAQAQVHYEAALTIRRALRPGGPEVAATETALAELVFSYGDFKRASGLLEDALRLLRASLPADHPWLAEALANAAQLALAEGAADRADALQHEALDIWTRKLGAEHPAVAVGLSGLGEIALARGRLDDAESSFAQALARRTKVLGPESLATAESMHQLATLHYARRDYSRAEPLLRLAVSIRGRALGPAHPDLAASLSYLGSVLVATGRQAEALAAFRRAQAISQRLLESVGSLGSEGRLDAVLRFLRAQDELVYSLLEEPDRAPGVAQLALEVALTRKGRTIDEAARLSSAAHLDHGSGLRRRFEQLREIRARMAHQALRPVDDAGGVDLATLATSASAIEAELAGSAAVGGAWQPVPPAEQVTAGVARALGAGEALVEFVRYRSFHFKARQAEPRWGAERYAAMVLSPDGSVRAADLGPAGPIDALVSQFHRQVTVRGGANPRGDGGADLRETGQKLEAALFQPYRRWLAPGARIFLATDGQLNLLPFWALHDGKGYLLDQHDFTYLTSGRDLLRRRVPGSSASVVVFADPRFGVEEMAGAGPPGESRDVVIVDDDGGSLRPFSRLSAGALRLKDPPSPLPGTLAEAAAIKRIFPRATIVSGAQATKDGFLSVSAPAVLHVGTHGIFRAEAERAQAGTRSVEFSDRVLTSRARAAARSEPLVNSMLLWSKVSARLETREGATTVLQPSGLATALEVASMNLWGTRLVVLSACESGRGQVDDLGQGVYGLRRALVVAGAETMVTSLWKVSDAVTKEFMEAYYARLAAGDDRSGSLRKASLAVRERYPEPRYWAPFIAIGRPGPVEELSR